ncbi:uncharacterized protein LOC143224724 isoform X2 [Tachypleus tridentatus]|uniref:uncharacterized protein LOC143224724 isoform X2 n=1 Tax=Tachypleus tridentatus TaxID=6853 RepID=UPI003FD0DB40
MFQPVVEEDSVVVLELVAEDMAMVERKETRNGFLSPSWSLWQLETTVNILDFVSSFQKK